MFVNRIRLQLRSQGGDLPVPKAWLDQFFMRNFTGPSTFDRTLAVGDGILEAGAGVSAGEIREQFGNWLRGRKMIAPDQVLVVEEITKG